MRLPANLITDSSFHHHPIHHSLPSIARPRLCSKQATGPEMAAKMDVSAWFRTPTSRMRQIAADLAVGCSTSEVAGNHGVTAGRISQL
jgi:hypothetical protein